MKKNLFLTSAILFLAGVFAAPGSEFWEKKEYKQWSQKDCAKLLEESPWVKTLSLTSVAVMDNSSDRTSTDSQLPYIKYQVQFNSAKPVRLAIVRQAQIAQKYDSLPPEQKQEMDKKAAAYLEADFSKAIALNISYSTNNRDNDMELARYWQTQTAEVMKNAVYLTNTKGEKLYLAQYVAGQGAARTFQFIFPRELNGKPFLSPEDKSLKLDFTYPVVGGIGDGKGFLEFKPDKMLFAGSIAY